MKRTRRFAAMIAAMALTATMAVPTMMSANATNVTIKKSADQAVHTYNAYQIFTGTYDAALGLKITGFGTGYNGAGLAADTKFRALEITPATETTPAVTVGSFLGSKTDAASVAQAIEKLNYANESASADALAKILAKYIGNHFLIQQLIYPQATGSYLTNIMLLMMKLQRMLDLMQLQSSSSV